MFIVHVRSSKQYESRIYSNVLDLIIILNIRSNNNHLLRLRNAVRTWDVLDNSWVRLFSPVVQDLTSPSTVNIKCFPVFLRQRMRIRFWAKIGSGALYLKRREILKISIQWIFRYFFKPSYLFSYFWCQTSPRAPDPVQILPDPDLG